MRSVADIGLGPTVSTILRGERINTVRTPVTDVGQSGEHEVTLRTVSTVGHVGVGTVTHLGVVVPVTAQHVVVVNGDSRVTGHAVVVVVIDETTHTETLVIPNAIAEVHTIDGHLVKHVGALEEFVTITDNGSAVRVEFRVVATIGIHIWALEEVDTHGRRLVAVSPLLTGTIDVGTVVAVTETTAHIATHIVIVSITQIGVNPLGEIGLRNRIGGTVDNLVGVERHVVEFVIGREAEALATDFKTDGVTLGLGVRTGVIVEDPEEGLITLKHVVGINHTVGVVPVVAVVHDILRGSRKGVLRGKGDVVLSPRAEVVVDVVVRVVTVLGIIDSIVVDIPEGGEVVGIAFFAVCRPIGNAGGHHVAGGVVAVDVLVNLGAGDLEELVEFDTHGLCRGGTAEFQRASPIVVTDLSETDSRQFQLIVGVFTTDPQSGAEHGRFARAFRHLIFGQFLEPHGTARFDVGAHIVHRQLIGGTCRKARRRFRFC